MVVVNLLRRMGLPPSNPQFDGHVPDVTLHKIRQRPHFLRGRVLASGVFFRLLRDGRRRVPAALIKVCLPLPDICPSFVGFSTGSAGRQKVKEHLPGHSRPRRHVVFLLDCFHVSQHPLPLIAASGRFRFGIIQPGGLVLPARTQPEP